MLYLLCLATPSLAQKVEQNDYFYVLNTQQGLSDNHILQMIQLPNGKMAVETFKGINLYDGKRFHFIPLTSDEAQPLPKYEGQIHLYADSHDRLWIKNTHQLFCVDLQKMQLIKNPVPQKVEDLFVDNNREVWYVIGNTLTDTHRKRRISLKVSWGTVQDVDCDDKYTYTFHASGIVAAFKEENTAPKQEGLAFTAQAYDQQKVSLYSGTSLVVKTPNGQFYQIRTGYDKNKQKSQSIFLHFDPQTKKYEKIFDCDYILHTLNMSSDNQALISSQHGYLMFDFKVGNTPREVRELSLPDGKSITTGINTVYRDQDGGIWLGTYNDGLIYVSPMLGLFFTIDKPWWQTSWGIACLCLVILGGFCLVALRKKETNRKEKDKRYEEGKKDKAMNEREPKDEQEGGSDKTETTEIETSTPEFITKAQTLVEQHLQDSEYGVEQLANDLCMERTGLYKKLTSLGESTPVAFIRNIRLKHAAELLKEGTLSVNEIAEQTGFSSPSYFTKCFKKEFGMLPSEYK